MTFWKHWPYWLRKGWQNNHHSGMNDNKLKKIDIGVIIVMSLILSALSVLSISGYFLHLEQSGKLLLNISSVLTLPYLILVYPILFLLRNPRDLEGSSLGSAIFAILLSPLVAFIMWFCIFYVLAKVSIRYFKSKHILATHGLSFLIVVLIVSPYAYYMFTTNQ